LDGNKDLDTSILKVTPKFRKQNTYALAPFLDGLNHSNVEAEGYFNKKTRCYQIDTQEKWSIGDQVFIYYGKYSNAKLLIEYGFILSGSIFIRY
jgi:hypothetical protein